MPRRRSTPPASDSPAPRRRARSARSRPNLEAEANESRLGILLAQVVQLFGAAGSVAVWQPRGRGRGRAATTTIGLSEALAAQLQPLLEEVVPRLASEASDSLLGARPLNEDDGPLSLVTIPLHEGDQLRGVLLLFEPAGGGAAPAAGALSLSPAAPDVLARNLGLLQRLLAEKRWLETVIQQSADGICIVDDQGRIVGFNAAWERLTGWRVSEVRGRPSQEIFRLRRQADAPVLPVSPAFLAADQPEGSATLELVIDTHDGGIRDVEVSCAVVRDPAGQVLGGIMAARDITLRKQSQELQQTFLSVVSHELQTPVAIIKGYAELLADAPPTDPNELREPLDIIRQESERLSKMVDNLLEAARFQAGAIELHQEALDVGAWLEQAMHRLRPLARTHRLELALGQDLPAIWADPERLDQVLNNLVENAVKYTPAGGRIRIAAERAGDGVLLSVEDQGAGIPETERQRVFERFSRSDSRLVRERKGAGLGLFIVKAIIEAHGGRIWIETAPGGGAAFRCLLPGPSRRELPAG